MTAILSDSAVMRSALALAERGLGNTWPNPAVGCVLVKEGRVVGRGWTQPGGRPHAETQALAQAGDAARGATAYVTLEPCSHHGQTPPCADALIAAGIVRCVVACGDSDPRVAGRGIARLRDAGIVVVEGVLAAEARALNVGFFKRIEQGLPFVTLKTATSLDGKIALANGVSQWITGPEARAFGHRLRAEHDAVLVGVGTVNADNPDLTCRLPGVAKRAGVRVVLDSQLSIPEGAKLLAPSMAPTWLVTVAGNEDRATFLKLSCDAKILTVTAGVDGRPDPIAALKALADQGITRVLIEGGGQIAASFLRAQAVDRIAWFRSAKILGGDAQSAIAALGLDQLPASADFALHQTQKLGVDCVEIYERR